MRRNALTFSTTSWRSLMLISILLVLATGCCKHGAQPAPALTPIVPLRSQCLRNPPPPPPNLPTSERPASDLDDLAWARLEQLEKWAAHAWAECGIVPVAAPRTP